MAMEIKATEVKARCIWLDSEATDALIKSGAQSKDQRKLDVLKKFNI